MPMACLYRQSEKKKGKEMRNKIKLGIISAACLLSPCAALAGEKTDGIGSEEPVWERKVSLGYNQTSGNTSTSELSGSVFINRNKKFIDELTFRGDIYYASSDKKMNSQKWYTMARYAFSFGRAKQWYNFYRMELDHDRFADVDYRITPATGIGYWLYNLPDLKAMAEIALGFEHTSYKSGIKDVNDAVLIPRMYFEKKLFGESRISQNVILYEALDDMGDYRLRSETVFTTPLSRKLSLNLKLIDGYDSAPAKGFKKNDLRFISSLTYVF